MTEEQFKAACESYRKMYFSKEFEKADHSKKIEMLSQWSSGISKYNYKHVKKD